MLTDWEAGQELIRIQDTIFERIHDLKESHPEIHKEVIQIALKVGDIFNNLDSHIFGLKGTVP